MANDPEAERIMSETYEPTEEQKRHQERIEADPRWPHEGGPPIGSISRDVPTARLAPHHAAKHAAEQARAAPGNAR
jgi:hypothetical protein